VKAHLRRADHPGSLIYNRHPRAGGDLVRCGLSIPSPLSLE